MTHPNSKSANRSGVWGWLIPVGLALIAAAISAFQVLSRDPYRPGAWLGNQSMFEGIGALLLCAAIAFAALISAFMFRPRDLFHAFWIIGLGLVAWFFMSPKGAWEEGEIRDLPRAMSRYSAERAEYKNAVQTKRAFGDQFSATGGGRTLNYWRWAQIGLDDAIGVVYDPSDKYPDGDADSELFRNQTHGRVFRFKRVEPHWILVWHS